MFVEVLARVRGEPSAGHSPPAAPSHSDTVTKGDPQIVLLYFPPSKVRHKDLARLFSEHVHFPQKCTCSVVMTQATNVWSDFNYFNADKGKLYLSLFLTLL